MDYKKLSNYGGVYAITDSNTQKSYIGFSTNVGRRLRSHLNSLRSNKHINRELQSAWNATKGSTFTCKLLQECYDEVAGYALENQLIHFGGDNLFNAIKTPESLRLVDDYRERFFRRIAAPNELGCTLWTGKRNKAGYGQFTFNHGGRRYYVVAHRAAFYLAKQDPGAAAICHTCGDRLCVNPDHLYLGANAEIKVASKDARQKVVELRQQGFSFKEISERASISHAVVAQIINRELGPQVSEALTPGCLSPRDVARFQSNCFPLGDCILYSGSVNSDGFPTFSWNFDAMKNTFAYRVAYFIEHGYVPPVVIQTCGNSHCVNPDHLQGLDEPRYSRVPRRYSPVRDRVLALYAKGLATDEIAARVDRHEMTVKEILKNTMVYN